MLKSNDFCEASQSNEIANTVDEIRSRKPIQLNIYPNPSVGYINIDITGKSINGIALIQVYDLLGKSLIRESLPVANDGLSEQLNIGSLSKGIYFCSIQLNGHTLVRKFIVQ